MYPSFNFSVDRFPPNPFNKCKDDMRAIKCRKWQQIEDCQVCRNERNKHQKIRHILRSISRNSRNCCDCSTQFCDRNLESNQHPQTLQNHPCKTECNFKRTAKALPSIINISLRASRLSLCRFKTDIAIDKVFAFSILFDVWINYYFKFFHISMTLYSHFKSVIFVVFCSPS